VTAVVEAVDSEGAVDVAASLWEFALIESNVVTECLGVVGIVVEVDTEAVLEVETSVKEAFVLLTIATVPLVVGSCDEVIEGTVVFITVADVAASPTGVEGTEVAAETVVKESVLLLLVRIVVEAVEEKVDFSKSS